MSICYRDGVSQSHKTQKLKKLVTSKRSLFQGATSSLSEESRRRQSSA